MSGLARCSSGGVVSKMTVAAVPDSPLEHGAAPGSLAAAPLNMPPRPCDSVKMDMDVACVPRSTTVVPMSNASVAAGSSHVAASASNSMSRLCDGTQVDANVGRAPRRSLSSTACVFMSNTSTQAHAASPGARELVAAQLARRGHHSLCAQPLADFRLEPSGRSTPVLPKPGYSLRDDVGRRPHPAQQASQHAVLASTSRPRLSLEAPLPLVAAIQPLGQAPLLWPLALVGQHRHPTLTPTSFPCHVLARPASSGKF